MNPCVFRIQAYSYQPVKSAKVTPRSSVKEQRAFLVNEVKAWVKDHPNKYPRWFLNAFVSSNEDEPVAHWNLTGGEGTKTNYFSMTVAKRKQFNVGKRLADAKRYSAKDSRWTQQVKYTPHKPKKVVAQEPQVKFDASKLSNEERAYIERVKNRERQAPAGSLGERLRAKFTG